MVAALKNILYKYRHGFLLTYFLAYIPAFIYLENTVSVKYAMRSWLDTYIPFQEAFIIPYYLWFFYVGTVLVYFLLKSKNDFYRVCLFLFTGMTICLILYAIFPNGQYLRPRVFTRDNFLVDMVRRLYAHDTSTNVCPSIHVLNSIGVNLAVLKSELFRGRRRIKIASTGLMVLICLSTVFLKQHSVIDVVCALLLSIPLYLLAYRVEWKHLIAEKTSEPFALKHGGGFQDN